MEKGEENLFKETIAENFHNLGKETGSGSTENAQWDEPKKFAPTYYN